MTALALFAVSLAVCSAVEPGRLRRGLAGRRGGYFPPTQKKKKTTTTAMMSRLGDEDKDTWESRLKEQTLAPGTVVDTVGDGVADSVFVDTVGDGKADSLVPLRLPWQPEAAKVTASPWVEAASLFGTIALFAHFIGTNEVVGKSAYEETFSIFLAVELFARWWATGLQWREVFRPVFLIDLLTLLPALLFDLLFDSSLPLLAPLRLLRAARLLRLLRFFEREPFARLTSVFRTGPDADRRPSEAQRVGARSFFSIAAIALIFAGVEWQLELEANPAISTYLDALYFSTTTLATVGFGDVTPVTGAGRLAVGLEMLAAVTIIPLELKAFNQAVDEDARMLLEEKRLAQLQECERCALDFHDADARFCKRCGDRLKAKIEIIPDSSSSSPS